MKHSTHLYITCLTLLSCLSLNGYSQVYKCLDKNNKTYYSDNLCDQAEVYESKQHVGTLKTINTRYQNSTSQSPKNKPDQKTCPFISTTEVRNLKVKNEFQKGLTMESIIDRYGEPHEREETGKNKEKWKYKDEKQKLEFKFKHGCLQSWKRKWFKKSKFD